MLRSPFAELRGKEGKFSFVSLPDSTVIESDGGQVRLTRQSDGRTVNVKSGQFAVVKSSVGPLLAESDSAAVTSPSSAWPSAAA